MLFAIRALDKPDSLQLRKDTRAAHLEYLADFTTPVGGPLLDTDGNMCGSLLLLEADSLDAAQAFAEGDPYRKAGLFESVEIHEFMKVAWPA